MAPAPLEQLADLAKRQVYTCNSGYYLSGNRCYPNHSGWYWWGRWVFAGLVVVFVIALLLLLARNSRRRRRRGIAPLRGTGWMAPPPYQPPPQYSTGAPVYPQGTGQKFNANDGYYANQQNQEGVQVQQPANTYYPPQPQHNEPVYAPPEGPPPKRT